MMPYIFMLVFIDFLSIHSGIESHYYLIWLSYSYKLVICCLSVCISACIWILTRVVHIVATTETCQLACTDLIIHQK